jgi:hypothetical protein
MLCVTGNARVAHIQVLSRAAVSQYASQKGLATRKFSEAKAGACPTSKPEALIQTHTSLHNASVPHPYLTLTLSVEA